MRRVVVLPEPLGPRNPVTRPGSTVNERSSTARTGPKCLLRPLNSIGRPRVVAPAVIGATLARWPCVSGRLRPGNGCATSSSGSSNRTDTASSS